MAIGNLIMFGSFNYLSKTDLCLSCRRYLTMYLYTEMLNIEQIVLMFPI